MTAQASDKAVPTRADALGRVLDAEKLAAAAIANARREADAIVAAANRAAHAEAERADRRIGTLHKCVRKALKKRRSQIDTAFRAHAAVRDAGLSDAELDMLIGQLARMLTGQVE